MQFPYPIHEERLTQEQVARRIQQSQSFVSKCERGERRIDVIELLAFCRAIGIPIDDFVLQLQNVLEQEKHVNYEDVLNVATGTVLQLKGHLLDVLTVKKPYDLQTAIDLSRVISKLSPIVGNTLESTLTRYLNAQKIWPEGCTWKRQDPNFPDILFNWYARTSTGD